MNAVSKDAQMVGDEASPDGLETEQDVTSLSTRSQNTGNTDTDTDTDTDTGSPGNANASGDDSSVEESEVKIIDGTKGVSDQAVVKNPKEEPEQSELQKMVSQTTGAGAPRSDVTVGYALREAVADAFEKAPDAPNGGKRKA
ncbi:hypothetical protein I5U67_11235 [Stenotrophomonas maltophilia]|uniref:Uncharacterized protein n=1 Tax=Stenotrophomonas maltophilia TaxID=40324 RepID=A0A6B8JAU0_STEMA|nr:hypothetical protein [Stenotrophomonas maltophilia]MBH1652740.1 hypothetical protein [Stenotrophomonas maltophilia]QGM02757.1 hypothetical protein FEO89_19250 [Stenotrophomonas maltophilia]HDS1510922.1 hypothetical protein [Stenotrophomonas maltophilia]